MEVRSKNEVPLAHSQVELAGVITDLLEQDEAVDYIIRSATRSGGPVLGVVSVNLDHIHHFGTGATLTSRSDHRLLDVRSTSEVEWLMLIDGIPLARRARKVTGRQWPRLSGSDLIEPILDEAEHSDLKIGFLGGASDTHVALRQTINARWPHLRLMGCWSPSRDELEDAASTARLNAEIRESGVDILVVCLGKPRQELWIARCAALTGAKVCLAFGAVVDFLAGRISRAPRFVANHGLEWAWRLAREPRRLARRYLLQGPGAYLAIRTNSRTVATTEPAGLLPPPASITNADSRSRNFIAFDQRADIAAIVVTYNSSKYIEGLIDSLRYESRDQSIRLIVVDNASTDTTRNQIREHSDVILIEADNLGYSAGLNAAASYLGDVTAVLVLNPDLRLEHGTLARLRGRISQSGVAASVPLIRDPNGRIYPSIRREPGLLRAIGDALLGEKIGWRPAGLSEIELRTNAYTYAHSIDWATGAVILFDASVYHSVGAWDESYFLYSEETDFLRRVREFGQVWFEPAAIAHHIGGASGQSKELDALLSVNRVLYQEKFHGRIRSIAYRGVVIGGLAIRSFNPSRRYALGVLTHRARWQAMKPDPLSHESPR